MAILTRTTDQKARVSLPRAFANSTVIIDQISDTEVRIRKARVIPEEEVRFLEESRPPLSDRDREVFLKLLGKPRSLMRYVPDRPGHDRRYAIDPTRLETALAWRPVETWDSGLAKTIRWYQENSAWVERARSGAYREYIAKQYPALAEDRG